MLTKTLYKASSTGKTVQLTYEIDGNMYRSIHGYVDGKLITDAWTIAEGKNKGKTNETSDEDQAHIEVAAKITKKKKEGYTEDQGNTEAARPAIKPMLAKTWDEYGPKTSFPVFSQPKLDGIRCVITKDGAFSREGNPFVTIPHILEEAQELLASLPPGTKLDGELYNEQLHDDFNKIVSTVKRGKTPTEAELQQSKDLVQYHIYDIDDGGVQDFSLRNRLLTQELGIRQLLLRSLVLVKTTEIKASNDLDILSQNYLQAGYEGQMIRVPNSLYENKRSKGLLKRKPFMDAEFEILGIAEGIGGRSGMAGAIQYKIKTKANGLTSFNSGIRGGVDFYKQLWKDRKELIGQKGTVRFQNYTPDGIPRFGVTVAIRDYE